MTNLRVYYLIDPTVQSHPDTIPLQDKDNILFHILFLTCFPQEDVLGEALTDLKFTRANYSATGFSELT